MEIWSIGTALRDPRRIPSFLNILAQFNNRYWDEEAQLDYYIELIRNGLVPKATIKSHQLNIAQPAARNLMYKTYTDAPMRGRVLGSLFNKLGFININNYNLTLTNRTISLLNGNISLSEALIAALSEWQYVHSFSQWNNVFDNIPRLEYSSFSPFVSTLYLISRVNSLSGNNEGISYQEYKLFAKTIDHYSLIEPFANMIINSRNNGQYLDNFKNFIVNNFDNLNNLEDYSDNDLKYFSETGLILVQQRINLNYDEIGRIENIIRANIHI